MSTNAEKHAILDKLTQDTYKIAEFFDMRISNVRLYVDNHHWVTGGCLLHEPNFAGTVCLPKIGIDNIHPSHTDSWNQMVARALLNFV